MKDKEEKNGIGRRGRGEEEGERRRRVEEEGEEKMEERRRRRRGTRCTAVVCSFCHFLAFSNSLSVYSCGIILRASAFLEPRNEGE